MIEVKWKGETVGKIANGRLTEATEAFENVWREFKKNGVTRIGPAGSPSEPDPDVLADGVYITYELEPFLVDLEVGGYEIVRTGEDTKEARIEAAEKKLKEGRKRSRRNTVRRMRRKLADVLAKGAERLRRPSSDPPDLDGLCELCGRNGAMGVIRLKPEAAKRQGQLYVRICGGCMEDMLDKGEKSGTVH